SWRSTSVSRRRASFSMANPSLCGSCSRPGDGVPRPPLERSKAPTGVSDSVTAENELRLEVQAGRARGFSLVVDERLVIGRNSEGPGGLADDPDLSRHHAEIVRAPSGE